MPASVNPMMASRWKHSQPDGVSMIRDMSGPRDFVRSKKGSNSSRVRVLRENPMIAHITGTSEIKKIAAVS